MLLSTRQRAPSARSPCFGKKKNVLLQEGEEGITYGYRKSTCWGEREELSVPVRDRTNKTNTATASLRQAERRDKS